MPFGLEPWLFWTLLSIVLFIVEIFTPGFFLACLGIGAALAVVPTLCDLSLAWQLAVFSFGSLLSLLFLRPLFNKPTDSYASGVDALMGRRLHLSEDLVEGAYTEVRIDGDVWRIVMHDGSAAESGTLVEVCGREGIVLQARRVH